VERLTPRCGRSPGFAPRADDPPGTVDAIAAEGERLLALVAPGGERRAGFDPPL
jgi:hypothetical protein